MPQIDGCMTHTDSCMPQISYWVHAPTCLMPQTDGCMYPNWLIDSCKLMAACPKLIAACLKLMASCPKLIAANWWLVHAPKLEPELQTAEVYFDRTQQDLITLRLLIDSCLWWATAVSCLPEWPRLSWACFCTCRSLSGPETGNEET